MSATNNRESLRSIVISYEEYQRLKTIESRFEELQKESNNKESRKHHINQSKIIPRFFRNHNIKITHR